MKKWGALLALVIALPLSAHADGKEKKSKSLHDQLTGQGYGMAGCGLGSIVFGEQQGLVQIVAATLNGTLGTQTFGISSGTSNCGEFGKSARADQFIEVNKVSLENDLARGAGESVVALSEVMGCHNSNFSVQMKSRFVPGATQQQLVDAAVASCQL